MRWPTAPLGELVEIKGGGTPSKANASYWNGDIPWVSPKDMKTWDIIDAEDKITQEAIEGSATTLVPESATLVVNRSGILKHTLPVGITRRSVAINQDLKALIPGPRIDANYVAHIVKAAEPVVLKWVRATTADNFPIDNLRSLAIPLPPLDEQRRIAAILDKADALRRKRKRALELLDILNQSTFIKIFGEMIDQQHLRYPVECFAELVASQKIGLVRSASELSADAPVPYVRMDAITLDGRVVLNGVKRTHASDPDISEYELKPGDFLFNTRNSRELVGKAAVFYGPCGHIYNNNILRIQFTERLKPDYVSAFFRTRFGRSELELRKSGTTSVFAVYQKNLDTMPIPVPPINDQDRFAEVCRAIHRDRLSLATSLRYFDQLFTSLQHRAFSGQL